MTKGLGFLLCVACLGATPASGQSAGNLIGNGDFENNTATYCVSNLSNYNVGVILPTAVGFGLAHEIDVYPFACYGLPAISGTTKVGLVCYPNGSSDAFSLALLAPVFAGDSLDLAFAAQAVMDFTPNLGTIEVGLSSVANAFGTLVYAGTLSAPSAWEWLGTSIIAPLDAGFITIRVATGGSWVHVDAFSLNASVSTLFCPGDGSGLACPCANGTAVFRGCANSSFASGARLYRTGNPGASATTDSLILNAAEVAGSGLFMQSTSYGGGYAFGDGLLCVNGSLTRLGIASPVGGLASLPHAGATTPIHVAGGVASGDVRYYQFWYRDAIDYCTPATFNLSQGMTMTWAP